MADQVFAVNSGFYDAVNNDRLYSADDMNRPYKRVISNGVFATPQGTPSTDLQVLAAGGMSLIVSAGQGVFADKWFESTSINVTVPSNTTLNPRIDSVLVQVDKRQSGRVANIIYRTGTPASSPVQPTKSSETNVFEYRVANVLVNAGTSAITQSKITDLRGSSECPWITSLVNQVDTSTLFTQWQTAYQQYYTQATNDFEEYCDNQRAAFDAFIESLTEELTASMNLMILRSQYTTPGYTATIPIGIPSFVPSTDILLVFINGLMAQEDEFYIISQDASSISLASALGKGQTVYFVCLHAVIGGDIQTTESMIQALNDRFTAELADTGWINLALANGATAYDSGTTPAFRKIGKTVHLTGAFKGVSTLNTAIATLPAGCRPSRRFYFPSVVWSGTTVPTTVNMEVLVNGSIILRGASQALSGTLPVSLVVSFPV